MFMGWQCAKCGNVFEADVANSLDDDIDLKCPKCGNTDDFKLI